MRESASIAMDTCAQPVGKVALSLLLTYLYLCQERTDRSAGTHVGCYVEKW